MGLAALSSKTSKLMASSSSKEGLERVLNFINFIVRGDLSWKFIFKNGGRDWIELVFDVIQYQLSGFAINPNLF